jgi:hypothetical protein
MYRFGWHKLRLKYEYIWMAIWIIIENLEIKYNMLVKCWWRYGQNIGCNKCNPLTLVNTKGTYAL